MRYLGLLLASALAWQVMLNASQAQTTEAYAFRIVPATNVVAAGTTVGLDVAALNATGAVMAELRTNVSLSLRKDAGTRPVISEVAFDGRTVEVFNPGVEPVDVSGWELEVGYSDSATMQISRVGILGPAVLGPGQVLRWTGGPAVGPSQFPEVTSPLFLDPTKFIPCGVILRDATWKAVDQVLLWGPGSLRVLVPWNGLPLERPADPTGSAQRIGSANHFRPSDWRNGPANLGQPNPGLFLPWIGEPETVATTPDLIPLIGGQWHVDAQVPNVEGVYQWAVGDGSGRVSVSAPFRVLPFPALELVVPEVAQQAVESNPGSLPGFVVRVPEAAPVDRDILLAVEPAGEFAAPARVRLPAGETSVAFAVTNLDDPIPDGRALVELRAELARHRAARVTLAQDDDERGTLRLAPVVTEFQENAGYLLTAARVILPQAVSHDVEVALASPDARVRLPATVRIPAGQVSAEFGALILDDAFYNGPNPTARVRATIPGWAPAEYDVPWRDDEFSGYMVTGPTELPEGRTTEVTLRLRAPQPDPLRFRLSFDEARLILPGEVEVPALTSEIRIPVTVPNNEIPNDGQRVTLCLQADLLETTCVYLQVVDDDLAPSSVTVSGPESVWLGDRTPWRAQIHRPDGRLYVTNVVGEVRVELEGVSGPQVVHTEPITFHDGVAEFVPTFTLPLVGAQLRVTAVGLPSDPRRIDVLAGGVLPGPWRQVEERAAPGTLLLLTAGPDDMESGDTLVEFDPVRWVTNRSLALPTRARTLTVSGSGRWARLGNAVATLLRVDLSGTSPTEAWPLRSGRDAVNAYAAVGLDESGARALVLVAKAQPGSTTMPAPEMEVQVLDQGKALPGVLALTPRFSGNAPAFVLIGGRATNEWILGTPNTLHRFLVGTNGVIADSLESANATLGFGPALFHLGDELMTGFGARVGFDPFRTLSEFGEGGAAVGLEGGRAYGLMGLSRFAVRYAVTRELRGSHVLPLGAPDQTHSIQWLRPWGTNGVAAMRTDRAVMIWQSPLVGAATADLELTADAPLRVFRQTSLSGSMPVPFERRWTVTNRGPDPAVDVELKLTTGTIRRVGQLAAGTSFTLVEPTAGAAFVEDVGGAAVTAGTHDPVLGNNTAEVRTTVLEPIWGSSRQLRVAIGMLAPAADGRTLWAVASPRVPLSPGEPMAYTGKALIEIDPVTGRVVRTLPTESDPLAVEPGPEGRFVYAAEGTNGFTRWTLGASTVAEHWKFEGESVRELVALPDPLGAVVVLTENRVFLWENGVVLPQSISNLFGDFSAEFARGKLWVSLPFGGLESYRIDGSGLTLEGGRWSRSFPFQPTRFSVGPSHLFFDQEVFDLDQPGFSLVPSNGHAAWAEPGGGAAYGLDNGIFRRYSVPGFQPEATMKIPGFVSDPVRFVRWGERGVALLRHDGWLLIDELPLVSGTSGADLAVTLQSETPLSQPGWQIWNLTVTNRSTFAASNVVVTLDGTDGMQLEGWEEQGGLYQQNAIVWRPGGLAAGAVLTYRVRLYRTLGPYRLTAWALGTGSPDSLPDHRVEVVGDAQPPPGDLQLRFTESIREITSGEPVSLHFHLTNASSVAVSQMNLTLRLSVWAELVSVTPGTRVDTTFPNDSLVQLGPLGAGESVEVEVRVRVNGPSLGWLEASVFGGVQDSLIQNNTDWIVLRRAAQTSEEQATGLLIPQTMPSRWKWVPAGNRLLAGFGGFPGLMELDPSSLALRRWIRLPLSVSQFAASPSGNRIWVGQPDTFGLARIDLGAGETLSITHFPVSPAITDFAPGWVTVPGEEDVLVIHNLAPDGVERTRAYRNGELLPQIYSPAESRDEMLSVSPEGRLFLTGPTRVMELRLTAQGIEPVREFPGIAGSAGPVSYLDSQIVFTTGRTFDWNTGLLDTRLDDGLWPGAWVTADRVQARLLRAYVTRSPVGARLPRVEGFAADTKEWQWRLPLVRQASVIQEMVGMGTNGTLLVDGRLVVLPSQIPGPVSAPLSLALSGVTHHSSTESPIPILVALTNQGAWLAKNAWLEVEHGTAATPFEPGTLVSPGITRYALGDLWGETNLSRSFQVNTSGVVTLRVRAGSETPDANPSDNEAQWSTAIPEEPLLYLEAGDIPEGTALIARLTGPTARDLDVRFRVIPGTAGEADFDSLEGSWHFFAGTTEASASGVRLDEIGEGPETFRLELVDPPRRALTSAVERVIRDRTAPVLTAARQTVPERDDGVRLVDVTASLSAAMTVPVEVGYELLGGSATVGSDFLAGAGRLRFEPGERSHTLRVPVVGDRQWETNETVLIRWIAGPAVSVVPESLVLTIQNDDPAPPPTLEIVRRVADRLAIEFTSQPGVVYRLETKTALEEPAWRVQSGTLSGQGERLAFELFGVGQARYFRVSAGAR